MYQYHYNVIVLSQDLSLYETVVAFPSLAGFTYIVSRVEKIDTAISDADLLICQRSAAEHHHQDKNKRKKLLHFTPFCFFFHSSTVPDSVTT